MSLEIVVFFMKLVYIVVSIFKTNKIPKQEF